MLFYLLLSGFIALLEVFPKSIRRIVLLTTFPYLIDFFRQYFN
ncbi:hypothetical protein RINTHM_260 [Richelia intracellularis HM01]|nr:hypothetical protein RINTHM_260 [Richelia intracellularis HM01]